MNNFNADIIYIYIYKLFPLFLGHPIYFQITTLRIDELKRQ